MNVRLEFVKVPGSANSGADSLSSQQSLTSSSAALALVAAVNQTDDSTLKNGAQEVCQSLINGDSSAVVKWLLSLQSNDPFIDGIKKLLAKEKKDVYLERLLKDQGRLYQLNRLGLVVECKFLDEPNSVARFRVLLPGDPEILSKFARYYHETNSHCSLRYVTYLFTRDFHAPNFKQVARSVIRGCAPCVEKRVKLASSGGLQSYGRSTSDLSGVWSTVYADTADMLIKDRFGFRYLLVVVDSLCGFCWLSPLKSLDAPELVRMITSFCDRIGWPRKFISDGGRNFVAKLTKDMFRTQGVIQEFVPRYSAFANGRAERCIGSVKAKFQTLTRSQKKEWSVHIPAINKSINLSPLPTGLTAFDIFFQRSYDSPLSRKIHSVNDLVLDKELKAEEVVSRTPPKSFKVGDLVRRSNKEANDNSVYEVISVNNRSVDVRRKGDNTSLPVKEHVRNLVLAQS
ncbi:hypothetical protein FOL47_002910 [Perkinsus chesapeaki]|uniref:Integrase catalytic domain-containing protein n=1 Tax=Perkinsus chesapeaki TaxID=330153 RepID=A0A7J6KNM9_PERCH|nr:hypothetical protein FOL47_002910 [Perkinsus chesapeaki]